MTKARDIADFKFENITDTGTEGTRVATGTNAQRGSTTGQLRFNTDTGLAEYYTGTAFKSIDAPPTVSSIDVTEVDSQAGGNQTIVITGSGFNSGATVTFVGASGTDFNASTVTVDSDTQITAVAPKASFLNAQEPYGVKVVNTSGLSATLASQINVDTSPSWSTASGTLATISDTATGTHATVSATDADGDTVVYSETTSVLSSAGLSLNSSTGAISGDPTDVLSSTTNTFTLRATANSKTADRSFNIIVNPTLDGTSSARAATSIANLYDINTPNGLVWFQNANINSGNAFQIRYASYNNKGWFEMFWSTDTAITSHTDHFINTTPTRPTLQNYNLSNGGLNYSSGDGSVIVLHSSLGIQDVAFTTKSSVTGNGVTATGHNQSSVYPLIASQDIGGTDAATIVTQLAEYFGHGGGGFHAASAANITNDYDGGWERATNDFYEIVLCYRDGAKNTSEWHIVDGESSSVSTGGTYASNYGYRDSPSYPAANAGNWGQSADSRTSVSSSNVMSIWVSDE
jgi:hypothetical protein